MVAPLLRTEQCRTNPDCSSRSLGETQPQRLLQHQTTWTTSFPHHRSPPAFSHRTGNLQGKYLEARRRRRVGSRTIDEEQGKGVAEVAEGDPRLSTCRTWLLMGSGQVGMVVRDCSSAGPPASSRCVRSRWARIYRNARSYFDARRSKVLRRPKLVSLCYTFFTRRYLVTRTHQTRICLRLMETWEVLFRRSKGIRGIDHIKDAGEAAEAERGI